MRHDGGGVVVEEGWGVWREVGERREGRLKG